MAAAALVAFAMSTSAIDVPRVANTLLEFSGDNQQALLEVIVDYILSPDDGRNSNSDKEDIPSDEPSCKVGKNKNKTGHHYDENHNIEGQTSTHCVDLAGEPRGADVGASCEETDASTEKNKEVWTQTHVSETTHCLQVNELGRAILGQFAACSNISTMVSTETLSTGRGQHKEADRAKGYTAHMQQGKPISQKTFVFLLGIGVKHFKNLVASFKCTVLQTHALGNTRGFPHNALSFSSTQFFVCFMFNYAKQYALLLPGRDLGYSRSDLRK